MAVDLRQLQRNDLEVLLTSAGDGSSLDDTPWRVLVVDNYGRDILAPFFKVKDLRECHITLHFALDAPRDPVPMVTAIYLCEPTSANIARIGEDCVGQLYDHVMINFTRPVTRRLLEMLAEKVRPLPSVDHIRVVERPLGFVALQPSLVTLRDPQAFALLNSRKTGDAAMTAELDRLASSIADVVVCSRALPYVAFMKFGPVPDLAERVMSRLVDSLRDDVFATAAVASALPSRPLLLILDRSCDLVSALHHPFSYQGLLYDELGAKLNKVDLPAAKAAAASSQAAKPAASPALSSSAGATTVIEIDPVEDVFLKRNALLDFGDIGEHVERELADYKREYDEVRGQQQQEANAEDADGGVVVNGSDDPSSSSTSDTAVARLLVHAPRLSERKRSVDNHGMLTRVLLKSVKEQRLDAFHGVEAGALRRGELDKATLFELLSTESVDLAHRQRLAVVVLAAMASKQSEQAQAELERDVLAALAASAAPAGGSVAPAEAAGAPATAAKSKGSSTSSPLPAYDMVVSCRQAVAIAGGRAPGGSSGSGGGTTTGGGWKLAESLARGIAKSFGRDAGERLPIARLVEHFLIPEGKSYRAGQRGGAAAGGGGGRGGGGAPSATASDVPFLDMLQIADPRAAIAGASSSATTGASSSSSAGGLLGSLPPNQADALLHATRFDQVFVVVVGGGSAIEAEELGKLEVQLQQKLDAGTAGGTLYGASPAASGPRIVYVPSELLTGVEMIGQLNALGSEGA